MGATVPDGEFFMGIYVMDGKTCIQKCYISYSIWIQVSQWISVQFMRFGYKCLFTLNWKGLDMKKKWTEYYSNRKNFFAPTPRSIYIASWFFHRTTRSLWENQTWLRIKSIQQNHSDKTELRAPTWDPKSSKTVHSTPLINPPEKKKKTWLVQLFFHIHNFPTSPNLPPSKKKVGRKNFSAESCLQRQLRRPLQGNINDRNLPSPGTRWDRLKVLDWRDLERWRFIGVPQKKKR